MGQFEWVILVPILCLLVWELVSVRRAIRRAGDKAVEDAPAEPARRWGAGLRDAGLRNRADGEDGR